MVGDERKRPELTEQQRADRKMVRPLLLEAQQRCQRSGVFVGLALQLELERLAHKVLAAERKDVERSQAKTVKVGKVRGQRR